MAKTIIIKRGRDASNGQFIPIDVAKRRGDTAIVDTMRIKK